MFIRSDLSSLFIRIYILCESFFNCFISGLISYAEYLFLLTILTSKCFIFKIDMHHYSAFNAFPETFSDTFLSAL